MNLNHSQNIEECKNIFPTWSWVLGILGSLAIGTIIAASVYFPAESLQDNAIKENAVRIYNLEVVNRDLDTIKTILRLKLK